MAMFQIADCNWAWWAEGNIGGPRELYSQLHTFGLKDTFLLLADCGQVVLQRFIVL